MTFGAKLCRACGARFEADRSTRKFCSDRCRQRANRALHRAAVQAYLRETSQHRLAPVRSAVADALAGDGIERLVDELATVYRDPSAWVHLEALARIWAVSSESELRRAADFLEQARGALWDRGLDDLS